MRRDRVALAHAGIDAHGPCENSLAGRKAEAVQRAGRRQESLGDVLGIKARLEGMAIDAQIVLRERQGLAGRQRAIAIRPDRAR